MVRKILKNLFGLKDAGLEEYLGIFITPGDDGLFRISQLFLIDWMIEVVSCMTDTRSAITPLLPNLVLIKYTARI